VTGDEAYRHPIPTFFGAVILGLEIIRCAGAEILP
jgi:hypothetical protein